MIELGVYETKARLSELIDKVEAGETVRVTRHGKPVARLVPDEEARRARSREAVAAMRALRESLRGKVPPTSMDEIIAWKNEGRR